MSGYRDMESYLAPQKRAGPPTRLEWVAAGLGVAAGLLLIALTTADSFGIHQLLGIDTGDRSSLRSLSLMWMLAGTVTLVDRNLPSETREALNARRFWVRIFLAVISLATILVIAGVVSGFKGA